MCLSPIILLFIIIGLIHLPPVQNYLVDKAADYLTEKTGYRSEIGYANIRWFNSVTIDDLTVYDQNEVKMIDVREVVISFKLKELIGGKDILINEAWLNKASVNLRDEGAIGLNIDNWVSKITDLTSSPRPAPAEPSVFSIDKITLLNSEFSLSDAKKDSITDGFDYNHFTLKNLRTDIRNLESFDGNFEINVQFLTAEDEVSGLKIEKLETVFQTSLKKMAFTNLDLLIGKSHIKDSVVLNFDDPSAMSEFVTDVTFDANFKNSLLHSDELSFFVPEFKKYDQQIKIDGYFQGKVNSFYSDDFTISFGEHSKLNGRLDIEGLPNINETIFDIDLDDSFLKATDIKQFINDRTFKISNKLGLIELNGQYDGLINDFVADGEFKTALGNAKPNVQITLPESKVASYSGRLSLEDFNVGVLTEDSTFQKVNLNGSIEGEGFTLEQANFKLDAKVSKIGILGYQYVNITTNGEFAQSFFSGNISVDDPNLIFKAEGSVDLRNNKRLFKINGRLSRADLTAINLTKEEVFVASDFNLDFEGVKLDSLLGNFQLTDAYLKYGNEDILVDSVFFSSQRSSRNRTVRFNSDYFNINMDGQFEFSTLLTELQNINGQYKLVFSSRSNEILEYLKTNGRSPQAFDITYSAELPNINPIIQLFDSVIYIGKNASLHGRFNNSNTEDFQLNAKIDSLIYSNISFLENEIDINASSLRDPEKVLALGYLYSKKQIYANTSETDALTLETVWDGKRIELRQNIEQTTSGNYAEIGAGIDFFENRTELRFQESNIIALDQTWNITENNVIVFGKDNISIENLDIYNDTQSITLDGNISVSRDSTESMKIAFENVEVENLNTLTLKSYSGRINGSVNIQNLLYNPLIFGDINIKEFKIDEFLVGDISGALLWNDLNRKFDINLIVDRLGKKIIQLEGDFFPSRNSNQLDLDLILNEANLNIGEPYIEDYFTQIAGNISGKLTVGGMLSDPLIRGNGTIRNGGIKINYLNTEYKFGGGVKFDKNLISLSELDFLDINGSPAQFRGEIRHNSFRDISLDLNGDLTTFQVLNTTVDNGDLYYGDAYASGNVSLRGAASNLSINADVTTSPNTKIYIPISETDDDTSVDYINFINLTDTTQTYNSKGDEVDKMKIEGLKLDLNINITPDAYTEIIIDPKTGDIIRGRGNGQLRLQIDTQGNFQMTGGLNITEGAYNFSLYNIITKEFDIEQPSRITWSGDPYTGIMDINASYSQNTSLAPILKQTGFDDENSSAANRRYPTKVLLRLNGPLLSPEIGFDIDFSEVNAQDFELQTALNAFKNRLASDEQELTRQVVNVIVLNSFSDSNTLNIGGQTASQNVSQLLSNQLSQLVAQLDENLEIDFDLASLNQDAYNTFQLRLSYTFLNGRLRVTREGGLSNQVDGDSYATDINSIAGDWTAEYLLTSDGRYKVKVYSRSNYNLVNSTTGGSTNQTSGASITQSSSFNSLSEFFTGVDKKRKKRREEELAKKKEENNSGNDSN
ncbi:translocation/assembly module TamB domain-containing protein [Roseivirga sp.]|uniref:translocation/assembly module TamB domain-containing protein n=1 Tax=Roseivirga sp. TaxID=1964215 RepID=UPI002B2678B7|nr:translocation/assembly module TamB domain-containing protein [Roseivirga sp.]